MQGLSLRGSFGPGVGGKAAKSEEMVSPQRTPGNACRDQSETEGLETRAVRRGRGLGFYVLQSSP